MNKRVFISYSHGDLGQVKRLAWELRIRGVDTWIDYDNLLYGEDWKRSITKAIKTSTAFLICISKKMLRPGYVNVEIQEALDVARSLPDGQISIVPVLLDDLHRSDLPWSLDRYNCEYLPRAGSRRGATLSRLVVSLGYPRPAEFGRRAEADYRELCALYFGHVAWWLFGRAIEPNLGAPKGAAEGFGNAPAEHYMIRTTRSAFLVCEPGAPAYPLMRRLQTLLHPNSRTIAGTAVPIIAVVEDSQDLRSRFLGLVTPTDLQSKWRHWYVDREAIAPHVWYEDPCVAYLGATVRSAYEAMGTILTGIPIVDKATGSLAGFLPHPGTREDWSRVSRGGGTTLRGRSRGKRAVQQQHAADGAARRR